MDDGLQLRNVSEIREGPPGSFYLYESGPVANQFIKQALFWIVIILIPILIIQFTGPSK